MRNEVIEKHYRENYNRLVKIVSRRLGYNPHLSEEAVQEAYTKALEHWDVYDHKRSFDGWFVTILNNCVVNVTRQEKDRGISIEEVGQLSEDEENLLRLDNNLVSREVRKMIMGTESALHKDIIYLFFIKGLSLKSILSLTEATSLSMVKKVISRFRQTTVESLK
jgi:RNA polymerase sigma factor (sigma-70 family)